MKNRKLNIINLKLLVSLLLLITLTSCNVKNETESINLTKSIALLEEMTTSNEETSNVILFEIEEEVTSIDTFIKNKLTEAEEKEITLNTETITKEETTDGTNIIITSKVTNEEETVEKNEDTIINEVKTTTVTIHKEIESPEVDLNYQIIPEINMITNNNAIIIRDEYVNATFSLLIPENNTRFNTKYNIDEQVIRIKGRGHSTWQWDKKPYKIKFSEPIDILGMGLSKNWVLLANYNDKSLMRNNLAFYLGQALNNIEYTPEGTYVDISLNGKYLGLYTLCEEIEISNKKVDITITDDIDTGFIIEIGGNGKANFGTDTLISAEVKYPKNETKEQFNYIVNYIKNIEKLIINGGNYDEYIDMNSFVDWFILHELSYNTDSSFYRSCFLTKDKDGKLKLGPPWDFDLAFGNYVIDNPNYDNWVTNVSTGDPNVKYKNINSWGKYLLNDPKFTTLFKSRWEEVSNKIVNNALKKLEDDYNYINYSQKKNFDVWQVFGTKIGYEPSRNVNLKNYDDSFDSLKNFLITRKNWIDKAIKKLP